MNSEWYAPKLLVQKLIAFASSAARRLPLSLYLHSQDDVYRFPYTEVCFGGGDGCNWEGCIESVDATVYDACEDEWNVQVESPGNVSSSTITLV